MTNATLTPLYWLAVELSESPCLHLRPLSEHFPADGADVGPWVALDGSHEDERGAATRAVPFFVCLSRSVTLTVSNRSVLTDSTTSCYW